MDIYPYVRSQITALHYKIIVVYERFHSILLLYQVYLNTQLLLHLSKLLQLEHV
nr:MAG TPA: hypothetical protein [Caudoviricetes sp.]